jgi:hypothetical protein
MQFHNHNTRTYPADKLVPKEVLQHNRYEAMEKEIHTPTSVQRKIIKKQHNRRARRFRNKNLMDYF